jgi:hypothetical protein
MSEDASGESSLDTPVDWSAFSELYRATAFGGDIDGYLVDIGVDPSVFSGDPPTDNV